MPSGDNAEAAVSVEELWQAELRQLLESVTIQTLRHAARQWSWTLKGTAKADMVEQMAGYLGDAARMAAAVQTLSAEEVAVLNWLVALGPQSADKQLRAALAEGSGIRLSQKALTTHLQNLSQRCLLFYQEHYRFRLPSLYRRWLPPLAAPKLQYATPNRLQQPSALSIAEITQHALHLLSVATAEQPTATLAPPSEPSDCDPQRPSLVDTAVLARWGYKSAAEQHLARFLLELLASAKLLRVVPQQQRLVIAPAAAPDQAWELATAEERLQRLRRAYLARPQARESESRLNSWSEWDMVFAQGEGEGIKAVGYYATIDQLLQKTQAFGVWLGNLIISLADDTWYSFEALCKLVFHVQRDFLIPPSYMSRWRWVLNGELLDPEQMSFDLWLKTYGRLVEAWLIGPARWLLFVQVGHADGRLAAFRRPSAPPEGEAQKAPAGSLRFMANGMIGLSNDWRVTDLRRLLRLISVEVARDAATTLLRLDAGTFRNTLQNGQDAAAVNQAFIAAGFPLPAAVLETLQTWQRRAGRYQLYDQIVVVEFGEDVSPEELRAISRMTNADFYQPGPRCLIFTDPQVASTLVDELRRRGYTPQVLP